MMSVNLPPAPVMGKPRILILAGYYLPGFLAGGPVRSIANMVELLGDEFEWLIITSDRDLGADRPYEGVRVDTWNVVGKASVYYASPTSLSPLKLLKLLRETPYDLLYLNSFFDPLFSVLPVIARRLGLLPAKPVLMAPRGEFSPGALRIKPGKKRAYLRIARWTGVLRGFAWQASTDLEASNITAEARAHLARVHIARDLVVPPALPLNSTPETGQELSICFLSRISPMKNLDFALRALESLEVPARFEIYGPIEDEDYWMECQALMAKLPVHVSATYCGPVAPDRVVEVFSSHDVFFLPTRGENFGHVLLESWSAGTPVLTSDRTPWRNLRAAGVGWDLSLEEPAVFSRVLEAFLVLGPARRAEIRSRCVEFARRHARDEVALEDNRRMFLQVLDVASGSQ